MTKGAIKFINKAIQLFDYDIITFGKFIFISDSQFFSPFNVLGYRFGKEDGIQLDSLLRSTNYMTSKLSMLRKDETNGKIYVEEGEKIWSAGEHFPIEDIGVTFIIKGELDVEVSERTKTLFGLLYNYVSTSVKQDKDFFLTVLRESYSQKEYDNQLFMELIQESINRKIDPKEIFKYGANYNIYYNGNLYYFPSLNYFRPRESVVNFQIKYK